MQTAEHPLIDTLTALFCREGSRFAGGEEEQRVHIAWQFQSGQWRMITEGKLLLGWASWFRLSDEALEVFARDGFLDAIAKGQVFDLTSGPHCYIATAVTAPWAPRNTLRELGIMVSAANRDARTLSAHFELNGRRVWRQRVLH